MDIYTENSIEDDIIRIMQSNYIVTSNSTFCFWATFFSLFGVPAPEPRAERGGAQSGGNGGLQGKDEGVQHGRGRGRPRGGDPSRQGVKGDRGEGQGGSWEAHQALHPGAYEGLRVKIL